MKHWVFQHGSPPLGEVMWLVVDVGSSRDQNLTLMALVYPFELEQSHTKPALQGKSRVTKQ